MATNRKKNLHILIPCAIVCIILTVIRYQEWKDKNIVIANLIVRVNSLTIQVENLKGFRESFDTKVCEDLSLTIALDNKRFIDENLWEFRTAE